MNVNWVFICSLHVTKCVVCYLLIEMLYITCIHIIEKNKTMI